MPGPGSASATADSATLTILHVDMDAFFASVEQRDHPEWRGRPVIVGAPPTERGVVSTCSYEARAFGVHSAMPSREAGRLCPNGIFVHPDMDRYLEASAAVFAIFDRYTPVVQGLSCDEAFLDVSGARTLFGDAVTIARRIREDIARELRLTASVGVAPNKFLAKLASDFHKPNGLTVVPTDPEEIARFLAPLPVSRIFGVGKVTEETLRRYGLRTIGDIQRTPLSHLERWLGGNSATFLHELAFGIDDRRVETEGVEKSISRETTFLVDEENRETVRQTLLELAADVAAQVRAAGKWAGTAHLKLRTDDFRTITRQKPFSAAAQDDFTFRDAACELFAAERPARPIRLIGFGVSHLTETKPVVQPDLFGPAPEDARAEKREALSRAMDDLRARFGSSISLGPKP